ncbi:MAG: hypothetical protein B7X70_14190 [Acidovorax sp. 39-64-12]|nr:MAG: hypothetical protein B7X70_14190 [Acidovorax sp. 39-64-12]
MECAVHIRHTLIDLCVAVAVAVAASVGVLAHGSDEHKDHATCCQVHPSRMGSSIRGYRPGLWGYAQYHR